MVADIQTIKNLETKQFITQKHAIAAFVDTNCEVVLQSNGYQLSATIPKKGLFVIKQNTLGELYLALETAHGDDIYRWFDKNTMKTQIYCTMNYLMNTEGLRFDLATHQAKVILAEEEKHGKNRMSMLEEAFTEYLEDVRKSLEGVDNFNFPEDGKTN